MTIKDWPEQERPREKLLAKGCAALSDAELLAIFLRTGIPGVSAVDLARELLLSFGGLRQLLAANRSEFCARPGLGDAKFAQLQAVLEMGRRHLYEELIALPCLDSASAARHYLQARLGDSPIEIFACLLLNSRHKVLEFAELSQGTLDAAQVYPRDLVQRVIDANAAAVILCHNHPSGEVTPSCADRKITERLGQVLSLIDVSLLDHIVVGAGQYYSFAERGDL